MYEAFYRLSAEPFRLSPDPKFCFPHPTYRKAMDYMRYALRRAEGFIVITGQPGTGKTTLINDLLGELESDQVVVARLVSTQLEANDLLRLVAYSFNLNPEGQVKADVLNQVERCLIQQYNQGRRSLLIVDEAQDVTEEALEELRLLTNIQIGNHPLLQIFLLGQEQLRDVLSAPSMLQLRQRLIAASHLEPLDAEDTAAYVKYRLRRVGWSGDPLFSNEAYAMIQQFSHGVPRLINHICTRLLLHGYIEEKHRLGVQDIKIIIRELHQEYLLPLDLLELADTDLGPAALPQETYEEEPQPVPVAPVDDARRVEGAKPTDKAQQADAQAHQAPVDLSPEDPPPGLTDEPELPVQPKEGTGREHRTRPPSTARPQEKTADSTQPVRPVVAISPGKEDSGKKDNRAGRSGANFGLFGLLAGLLLALLYASDFNVNRLAGHELWPWNQPGEPRVGSTTSMQPPPTMSGPDQNTSTGTVAWTSPAAHEQSGQKMLQTGQVRREESEETIVPIVPVTLEPLRSLLENETSVDTAQMPEEEPHQSGWQATPLAHEAVVNTTEQLEIELGREGLIVDRLEGNLLKVNLSSDGIFDFDSAIIREGSRPELNKLAAVLRNHDRTSVLILGHTDSSGPEVYNLLLSQYRAKAVENYLINQDLPKARIQSEGRGDRDTRHEVSTLKTRKRRVEIIIKPIQQN